MILRRISEIYGLRLRCDRITRSGINRFLPRHSIALCTESDLYYGYLAGTHATGTIPSDAPPLFIIPSINQMHVLRWCCSSRRYRLFRRHYNLPSGLPPTPQAPPPSSRRPNTFPFISHTARSPVAVFVQKMSAFPSPLKSPTHLTIQPTGTFPRRRLFLTGSVHEPVLPISGGDV